MNFFKTIIIFVFLAFVVQAAEKNVTVVFDLDGVILDDTYRTPEEAIEAQKNSIVLEGAGEKWIVKEDAIEAISRLVDSGHEIAFFSARGRLRNVPVLKQLILPSGKSAYDVAKGRVFSRGHMLPGVDSAKKNLEVLGKNIDLERVFLIDDKLKYVDPNQPDNVVWLYDGDLNRAINLILKAAQQADKKKQSPLKVLQRLQRKELRSLSQFIKQVAAEEPEKRFWDPIEELKAWHKAIGQAATDAEFTGLIESDYLKLARFVTSKVLPAHPSENNLFLVYGTDLAPLLPLIEWGGGERVKGFQYARGNAASQSSAELYDYLDSIVKPSELSADPTVTVLLRESPESVKKLQSDLKAYFKKRNIKATLVMAPIITSKTVPHSFKKMVESGGVFLQDGTKLRSIFKYMNGTRMKAFAPFINFHLGEYGSAETKLRRSFYDKLKEQAVGVANLDPVSQRYRENREGLKESARNPGWIVWEPEPEKVQVNDFKDLSLEEMLALWNCHSMFRKLSEPRTGD